MTLVVSEVALWNLIEISKFYGVSIGADRDPSCSAYSYLTAKS